LAAKVKRSEIFPTLVVSQSLLVHLASVRPLRHAFVQTKSKRLVGLSHEHSAKLAKFGSAFSQINHYVFEVRPGRILFEVEGVDEELAKEAFRKATAKLPLTGKLVRREETRA
jgi:Ribosomal protein L16p/L10e